LCQYFLGIFDSRQALVSEAVFVWQSPRRFAILWMCVSTGKYGFLKICVMTTFAVFSPTPGRETSFVSVFGTLFLKSVMIFFEVPIMFFDFVL